MWSRHGAQVADEVHQRLESDVDRLDVDHRQSESGPGQQVAGGADVDLGMDSSRRRTRHRVRGEHRPLQPRQAAGAGEGAEEQAVRPQRPSDQKQRARQIVDGVERARRDDQVEGAVGEGQPVLVLDAAGQRAKAAPERTDPSIPRSRAGQSIAAGEPRSSAGKVALTISSRSITVAIRRWSSRPKEEPRRPIRLAAQPPVKASPGSRAR